MVIIRNVILVNLHHKCTSSHTSKFTCQEHAFPEAHVRCKDILLFWSWRLVNQMDHHSKVTWGVENNKILINDWNYTIDTKMVHVTSTSLNIRSVQSLTCFTIQGNGFQNLIQVCFLWNSEIYLHLSIMSNDSSLPCVGSI